MAAFVSRTPRRCQEVVFVTFHRACHAVRGDDIPVKYADRYSAWSILFCVHLVRRVRSRTITRFVPATRVKVIANASYVRVNLFRRRCVLRRPLLARRTYHVQVIFVAICPAGASQVAIGRRLSILCFGAAGACQLFRLLCNLSIYVLWAGFRLVWVEDFNYPALQEFCGNKRASRLA